MKNRNLFFALTALILFSVSACNGGSKAGGEIKIANQADSVASALGYSVGSNLKEQFPDLNPEIVAKVIVEVFNGKENQIFNDPQIADTYIRNYLRGESEKKGQANKAKGEAFLADNAKKSGVKVTPSGLQYEVIKEGSGARPTSQSTVKVHYHGTTIDGEVFDSSIDKDPVTFPLGNVIKGWTEGLQLMTVGSKYKFYIPNELAYGARKAGAKIEPYSALIFEVELLEIVKEQ
jgi:FKBP-type peptidyl-prolyl cis-trans isomerase